MIAKLDGAGPVNEDWRKINEIIDTLNSLENIPVHINTAQYNFVIADGNADGTTTNRTLLLPIAPTSGKFHITGAGITLELT